VYEYICNNVICFRPFSTCVWVYMYQCHMLQVMEYIHDVLTNTCYQLQVTAILPFGGFIIMYYLADAATQSSASEARKAARHCRNWVIMPPSALDRIWRWPIPFIQEKLDGRGLPVLLAAQTSVFMLKDNGPEEAKT